MGDCFLGAATIGNNIGTCLAIKLTAIKEEASASVCSCPGWPRKGQLFLGPLAPQNNFVTLVLQNNF